MDNRNLFNMSDKEDQLTQREWDRVVGIGKTQPPSKSKRKNIPLDPKTEYVVVPLSPFTNHKPTLWPLSKEE